MVSDYIPGGDETLITLVGYAYEGEILSSFTGRKRSQRPHHKGVACIAESYLIEGILNPSQNFVKACGYTGIFQVELKRHAQTKIDYFIEVYPRNWLWAYLATESNRNLAITKFEKEANNKKVVELEKQTYNFFLYGSRLCFIIFL